jgi:diguanylate cyclase (GGDEF)-like protein
VVLPDEGGDVAWYLVRVTNVPPGPAHDPLTGLAGRALVLDRVAQALERRRRRPCQVELIVVDLNAFKQVNDTLGHLAGDVVLVEVAARLSALLRPSDTVARWGGDEFIVLLDDAAGAGGRLVCERLVEALRQPIDLQAMGGGLVTVSASCGWVVADDDDDASALLHEADLKMYEQKRRWQAGRRDPGGLGSRVEDATQRTKELQLLLGDTRARTARVLDAVRRARTAADR